MGSKQMEKKSIQLPQGGTLEVEMTPEFLSRVRAHFNLPAMNTVADDHIRMFIWGAFKNAIDKAEKSEGTLA